MQVSAFIAVLCIALASKVFLLCKVVLSTTPASFFFFCKEEGGEPRRFPTLRGLPDEVQILSLALPRSESIAASRALCWSCSVWVENGRSGFCSVGSGKQTRRSAGLVHSVRRAGGGAQSPAQKPTPPGAHALSPHGSAPGPKRRPLGASTSPRQRRRTATSRRNTPRARARTHAPLPPLPRPSATAHAPPRGCHVRASPASLWRPAPPPAPPPPRAPASRAAT